MEPYTINPLPATLRTTIAENHRKLRKQLGYTQAELADRSGVSLGSLKRFEQSGKISLENLLLLAHILGRLQDFEQIFHSDVDMKRIAGLFSDKMRGV